MRPSAKMRCTLVTHGYSCNDPPAHQAVESLSARGVQVSVFHAAPVGVFPSPPSSGAMTRECPLPGIPTSWGPLHRLAFWGRFRRELASFLEEAAPDLVVTIMLHALALLPSRRDFRLISCVYDIPSLPDAGRIDRPLLRAGWSRLEEADLVWASDTFKAELAVEAGGLSEVPRVCHNCPPSTYLEAPAWPPDGWLREELRRQGASLGPSGGCILLRTGAVGSECGLEPTLQAMQDLPDDFVFLLIGRPTREYAEKLRSLAAELGLHRRVFLWINASDVEWKLALRGADIGHLVHGPYSSPAASRLFALNSSLSNNRLFQYMAAGLPIVAYDDSRLAGLFREAPCFEVARWSSLRADLREVLGRLSSDPARRRALGHAGRTAHLAKYNWETQFGPVADAAIDLLAAPGAPRRSAASGERRP